MLYDACSVGHTICGDNMSKKEKKKINTDPFGSYTGRGDDPYEVPVQDADDL